MPDAKQLSETSQAIARYLVEHGQNPLTRDGTQKEGLPNHYEVRKELPDGRNLRAYFCDINKAGPDNPMSNSRLEVTLQPFRDDQVGYHTMEYDLTGEFEEFRILTGTANNMLDGWFHFERDTLSDSTRGHLQEKYDKLMKEVYVAFIALSGE